MPSLARPVASLAIRSASEAEIPALRALAEKIWRESYVELLTPGQIDYMLAWMYAPETIARELREGVIWEIAWLDSEMIGFHSCTFEPEPRRLKLNKLYLLPEQQGLGFGQQLLERVHALAAERGAGAVWLQVNKQNARALRAYERAGYAVERSTVFDIGGGYVMDDFILTRAISLP
ncbi:GCN5-related N-acetyltransferase [Chthoniobacter flavus Ellin428]|uniref:GCN5-related N-acetyltransferase n=1 Tax=Chthoniobacter flavus Ellin428 TaxID=497964 RepID=B4D7Z6_9BACT|nr:GNAT family N-acetyltransferase [Chthoniobacter flavus]EDY17519.1 GCN5-related N-acetyltransferase [Chthoniobacter flavus Ellin428]TCO92313.1 ribosomal protein S18 acetylase RimI-like enzyme [Chthoniobacter flavus]